MQTVTTLEELKHNVGLALTNMEHSAVKSSVDFGSFGCSVEDFGDFQIATRDFENRGKGFDIPFTCRSSGIHMAFSLTGQSVFNNRVKPFILPASTHSLNFFHEFQCANVVNENSRQYDITFRLSNPFYRELVTSHLFAADDPLPRMIHDQQEFNTINDHVQTDAGMQGILSNIISCPHSGQMKTLFVREHLRALLILQIFHFQRVVTGKEISLDSRINKRDRDILVEIKEFIDLHFLEPSSLEGLSRRFGINEFKIKHGFKSLFDASPIRYLQQKRLTFSLSLLRDTNKSIKEIADELGYAHAANFTTAFTKAFRKSPLAYRSGKNHF
jgi:AraC-like DNA-binding protein